MRTPERCVEVRPADHVYHIVSIQPVIYLVLFLTIFFKEFSLQKHRFDYYYYYYGNGLFCAILKFVYPPRDLKRDKAVKKRRDIIK